MTCELAVIIAWISGMVLGFCIGAVVAAHTQRGEPKT